MLSNVNYVPSLGDTTVECGVDWTCHTCRRHFAKCNRRAVAEYQSACSYGRLIIDYKVTNCRRATIFNCVSGCSLCESSKASSQGVTAAEPRGKICRLWLPSKAGSRGVVAAAQTWVCCQPGGSSRRLQRRSPEPAVSRGTIPSLQAAACHPPHRSPCLRTTKQHTHTHTTVLLLFWN